MKDHAGAAPFWREPRGIAGLGLAGVFLLIGLLFLLLPQAGARFFGTASPEGVGLTYVRAVGARDLALAGYLAGLVALGNRRALALVLGASVVNPICDLVLVAAASGRSAIPSLALHAAAGVVLAALAWWVRAPRET